MPDRDEQQFGVRPVVRPVDRVAARGSRRDVAGLLVALILVGPVRRQSAGRRGQRDARYGPDDPRQFRGASARGTTPGPTPVLALRPPTSTPAPTRAAAVFAVPRLDFRLSARRLFLRSSSSLPTGARSSSSTRA